MERWRREPIVRWGRDSNGLRGINHMVSVQRRNRGGM